MQGLLSVLQATQSRSIKRAALKLLDDATGQVQAMSRLRKPSGMRSQLQQQRLTAKRTTQKVNSVCRLHILNPCSQSLSMLVQDITCMCAKSFFVQIEHYCSWSYLVSAPDSIFVHVCIVRKPKESGAAQPKKKPKKRDVSQTTDQAVAPEAADEAQAHPNLANAPTHGLDEPLQLDYDPDDGRHDCCRAIAPLCHA